MKTAIVPLIKNKIEDSSDKGNKRPIALVTACSKMLEIYWKPVIISLDLKVSMLQTCALLQLKV